MSRSFANALSVLKLIANEPMELSHDKQHAQLSHWKRLAQEALRDYLKNN